MHAWRKITIELDTTTGGLIHEYNQQMSQYMSVTSRVAMAFDHFNAQELINSTFLLRWIMFFNVEGETELKVRQTRKRNRWTHRERIFTDFRVSRYGPASIFASFVIYSAAVSPPPPRMSRIIFFIPLQRAPSDDGVAVIKHDEKLQRRRRRRRFMPNLMPVPAWLLLLLRTLQN